MMGIENNCVVIIATSDHATAESELDADGSNVIRCQPVLSELHSGISNARMEDNFQQNTINRTNCTVQDAHDRIHRAWSLLAKSKTEYPNALLDIAIYMFRQALSRHPRTHVLLFDAQKRLICALCARFIYTRREGDLSESLRLCLTSTESFLNGVKDEGTTNVTQECLNDNDPGCIVKMGTEILARFLKPTSVDALNNIIHLLESSLALIPAKTHPNRVRALVDLAVARYFLFCHSSNALDLDSSISSLQDAIESCTSKNFTRFFIALQLCAVLTTRSLHGGNLCDFQEAIKIFRAEHDPTTGLPFAMAYEQGLLDIVQSSAGDSTPDTTISLMRETLANRLETAEHYGEVLHQLSEELLARFQRDGLSSDLEEAILLYRRCLELRPSTHTSRSNSLDSLAHAIAIRFDRNKQYSDLDEIVSLHREAVKLRPTNHPGRSMSLHNLSVTLVSRSQENGVRGDLDEGVALARESLELRMTCSHDRYVGLTNLANALLARFRQDGVPLDLDESILLYKDALTILPIQHALRLEHLEKLAAALCTRFEQNLQICDIDHAILLRRDTVEFCSVSHPELSAYQNNLAKGLRLRFGQTGHRDDLDEAISVGRNVLELRPPLHPDRPDSLNSLASALNTRFNTSGQVSDLDEAILLLKEALHLWPSSSPGRYVCIGDLSQSLRIRFEEEGAFDDLEEAIVFYREVIQHQNGDHPDQSVALANLANALETRFQQNGQRSDLDEAISLNRQAVELDPPHHPDGPRTLHNLAVKIYARFEQAKNWEDNDEVISLERRALIKTSASHPLRSDILNVLANALASRHEQTKQDTDLDEAVLLHRKTLDYPDPTNAHSMNLATALIRRSKVAGYEGDLDDAILLLRKVVQCDSASPAKSSNSLVNLASALGTRFGRADQPRIEDIEEAISLHKQSIELLPQAHMHQHTAIFNLAVTFLQAHSVTQDSKYLDSAMSLFSNSLHCSSQSASDRFRTAIIWSRHACQTRHNSTFEAYDAAMQGLAQIAALSLDIQSRQDILRIDSDGLARSAARYAIEHGHLDKAIEYLEEGRTVFWSQVLRLRSPFDELTSIAPVLAHKMCAIAAELERGSYRKIFSKKVDNRSKMSQEAESTRLRRLDDQWCKSLVEIRALDGFEDFLRPSGLKKLRACTEKIPVAYLVEGKATSDCIIMTKDQNFHVPLSNMPMSTLCALVQMIKVATSQVPILRSSLEIVGLPLDSKKKLQNLLRLEEERASKRAGHRTFSSDSIFQYVLHILWEEVVEPVIKILRLQKSENPPIIRWCPTGLFTFLPIHAAGCYNTSLGSVECTFDYLVSSYIPTVGVMLGTRTRHASELEEKPFRMMTVIDTGLPFASVELNKIKARIPNNRLVSLGTPGVPALVDDVYNGLPASSIVHFACHGTQDRSNPLNSGLHVHKGMLTISKILQQPPTRGSLAFLCACQTAMGDENVPDEAMSIGASLLFAGFCSVVATMWNIADADGPIVADVFYEELFRGFDGKFASGLQLEATRSARSLHTSVQHLRSTGVEFRRWVPFIHLGK